MPRSQKISFKKLSGLTLRQEGLNVSEVSAQRARFSSNFILEKKRHPLFDLVMTTLRDPMILFLAGLALLFWLLGDRSEALSLSLALIPLVGMDFFLHFRTEASLSQLKSKLGALTHVRRDGQVHIISSEEVVPGDRIELQGGESIPADGVLLESSALQVDESTLTGESLPLMKRVDPENDLSLALQSSEAWFTPQQVLFAGTRVLSGKGQFLVLETGRSTVYGQLLEALESTPHEATPLQRSIGQFVSKLIWIALGLCLILAIVRLLQGQGWVDALLSAATLAVAAIPEEFPVVFSFFLGLGAYRLSKVHVLVRRAVSVEDIGRINRICTDKTGTLTTGQVILSHLVPVHVGAEDRLLRAARAASQALAHDPVDQAVFSYLSSVSAEEWQETHRFPYIEERKCEVSLGQYASDQKLHFWLKGAPSVVLARCVLSEDEQSRWEEKVTELAGSGHKVLACAALEVTDIKSWDRREPQVGYSFLGLLAFEDPLRPGVREAIQSCQGKGIAVMMLTGDHAGTASAIAREMGLGVTASQVVSGEEEPWKLQEDWIQANPNIAQNWKVIARCSPLQKRDVVSGLRVLGERVLVTGDGVNDIAALKKADIGIAMGIRGSQGAKESASMILMDDHFASIVRAIVEGRLLFSSLKKAFHYLILMHIPLVLSAALVPLLGYPLLYLPIHIIWLELIIHPTALFAFQGAKHVSSADGPEPFGMASLQLLNRADAVRILTVGALVSVLALGVVLLGQEESFSLTRARLLLGLAAWSAALVLALSGGRHRVAWVISLVTLLGTAGLTYSSVFWSQLGLSPLAWREGLLVCGFFLLCVLLGRFFLKRG